MLKITPLRTLLELYTKIPQSATFFFAECKINFWAAAAADSPCGERDSGPRVREDKLSPEWRYFIFSDTAEFGIVRKDKKNPPFRRKPESHSPEANPPFALSRKEIPAFAGMVYFN